MAMPEIDNRGLLPEGVHTVTLDEIERVFGRVKRTTRRDDLFRRLNDYVTEVRRAAIASAVIINGSFVMACVDEPDDIDVILVYRDDFDRRADLAPTDYNLVSKRMVRRKFLVEPFAAVDAITLLNWTEFFQQVSPKWCAHFGWSLETKNGILRVEL